MGVVLFLLLLGASFLFCVCVVDEIDEESMDEFEKEYRGFFKKIDDLFNSHPGLITDEYHKYEIKAFLLFGLYNLDEKFAIEKRRQKESEFLSKKKEAEIAEEERIKEYEALHISSFRL